MARDLHAPLLLCLVTSTLAPVAASVTQFLWRSDVAPDPVTSEVEVEVWARSVLECARLGRSQCRLCYNVAFSPDTGLCTLNPNNGSLAGTGQLYTLTYPALCQLFAMPPLPPGYAPTVTSWVHVEGEHGSRRGHLWCVAGHAPSIPGPRLRCEDKGGRAVWRLEGHCLNTANTTDTANAANTAVNTTDIANIVNTTDIANTTNIANTTDIANIVNTTDIANTTDITNTTDTTAPSPGQAVCNDQECPLESPITPGWTFCLTYVPTESEILSGVRLVKGPDDSLLVSTTMSPSPLPSAVTVTETTSSFVHTNGGCDPGGLQYGQPFTLRLRALNTSLLEISSQGSPICNYSLQYMDLGDVFKFQHLPDFTVLGSLVGC